MRIQNMFAKDINRKISGVIKVMQNDQEAVQQEVSEYVITKELQKHFLTFFTNYVRAFDQPTTETGVWISGFFGSGKSHFLKMLSYILSNQEIGGKRTIDQFLEKFAGDPAMTRLLQDAAVHPAKAVLFNIDQEGFSNKDKTVVMRVFAKMFYKHLGFYGDNLKVARLEWYLASQGKLEKFRRVFQELSRKTWEDMRQAFAFQGRYVIPALVQVDCMSREDAEAWFRRKEEEFSIAQLARDMKAYVERQPADFRLIFLADEVGQYVGENVDMLLNLQSILESVGDECGGKVWIICTGQEALDDIIKVRADAFSKIQDRFSMRLSLSSSSVDEVIQKRILRKTEEAERLLEDQYREKETVLENLFSFRGALSDIKGFGSAREFADDYPFVPYQFLILQKVFTEIRKHGNAGKSLSGGERSMLSGFQEAAKQAEGKDETALVPFYTFYDTVHGFLDSSIRRVVERCERAADHGDGLIAVDVHVLKLLYLIRYIDDIPSNVDNISILMADAIDMDKASMKAAVEQSLGRLCRQNYVSRTGDEYKFLTDEEQDVQREINNTIVDSMAIVRRMGEILFTEIVPSRKVQYDNKMNFPFDGYVDGTAVGGVTGGMRLQFYTDVSNPEEKDRFHLIQSTSADRETAVVLGDSPYYETIRGLLQIRLYVQQKNLDRQPKSVKDIIKDYLDEASLAEARAREELRKAVEKGTFYVGGEEVKFPGPAEEKIKEAMKLLVGKVYTKLDFIDVPYDSDEDIRNILDQQETSLVEGAAPNEAAVNEMADYLHDQHFRHQRTTMQDIQRRFSTVPYGWREIDIAAAAAALLAEKRATLTYGGQVIAPRDSRVPDMLRRRSETGKSYLEEKQLVRPQRIKAAREFLKEYLAVMSVPENEDGLVSAAADALRAVRDQDQRLLSKYIRKGSSWNYPGQALLRKEIDLIQPLLAQTGSNITFVEALLGAEEDLLDSKEDLEPVKEFFQSQKGLFDQAVSLLAELDGDRIAYLDSDEEITKSMNEIRRITLVSAAPFNYRDIPKLRPLIDKVEALFREKLGEKQKYVRSILTQCMEALHAAAGENRKAAPLMERANRYYNQQKDAIERSRSLTHLDGIAAQIFNYRDDQLPRIAMALAPKQEITVKEKDTARPAKKKDIRTYRRSVIFSPAALHTEADIDRYVESLRKQLQSLLSGCDEVKIQ